MAQQPHCINTVRLCLAIVLAMLTPVPSSADETAGWALLEGRISHVRDGDTVEIDGQAVRLRGVTCEETGDETGALADAATARIRALTGHLARCTLNGERSHDRVIGWCTVDGRDLGALLIGAGLCGRCARYDPEERYAALAAKVPWKGAVPGYCRTSRL